MERRSRVFGCCLAAAAIAVAAPPVLAQTVYKLIDRNGKVTYVETPPKDFDGRVIRVDIDPNANKASLGAPRFTPPPQGGAAGPAAAADHESQVTAARERRDAARKALADARDHPAPDDMRFLGKVGGGSRAVPTDAYQQRLDGLERALKEAEDDLAKLQAQR